MKRTQMTHIEKILLVLALTAVLVGCGKETPYQQTSIPTVEQTITPYYTPTVSATEENTPVPTIVMETNTPIPFITPASDNEGEIFFFAIDDQKNVKLNKVVVDKEVKPKEIVQVQTKELPYDIENVYVSPDGKHAIILRTTEGLAGIILDLKSGDITEPLSSFVPKNFLGWFPDSKQYLVSGTNGLWLIEPSKKETMLALIGNNIGHFSGAAASPDGKLIIYSFVPQAPAKPEIWKVNDKGGEGEKILEMQDIPFNFAWSPDGKRIAFRSGAAYWVMNADGTGLKMLVEMVNRADSLPPVWSPNSKYLLVDTYGRPSVGGSVFDGSNIFIINTENGEKRTLFIDGSDGSLDPAWSPDGRYITFVSNRSGKSELWIIQEDGSNASQLTSMGMYLRDPFWTKP